MSQKCLGQTITKKRSYIWKKNIHICLKKGVCRAALRIEGYFYGAEVGWGHKSWGEKHCSGLKWDCVGSHPRPHPIFHQGINTFNPHLAHSSCIRRAIRLDLWVIYSALCFFYFVFFSLRCDPSPCSHQLVLGREKWKTIRINTATQCLHSFINEPTVCSCQETTSQGLWPVALLLGWFEWGLSSNLR